METKLTEFERWERARKSELDKALLDWIATNCAIPDTKIHNVLLEI